MRENGYVKIYIDEMRKGVSVKDAVRAVSVKYKKDKEEGWNDWKAQEAKEFFAFLAYFTQDILKNDTLITDLYAQSQKDSTLLIIKEVGDARASKKYRADEKLYKLLSDEQIAMLEALTDNISRICEKSKAIIFMETKDGSYFQVFDHLKQREIVENMLLNAVTQSAYILVVADDKIFGFYCEGDGYFKPNKLGKYALSLVRSLYEEDLVANEMSSNPTPVDAAYMLIPR